jgi:hypothetical protein
MEKKKNRAKAKQLKCIEQNTEQEEVILEERRTDRAPTTMNELGQNGLAGPQH